MAACSPHRARARAQLGCPRYALTPRGRIPPRASATDLVSGEKLCTRGLLTMTYRPPIVCANRFAIQHTLKYVCACACEKQTMARILEAARAWELTQRAPERGRHGDEDVTCGAGAAFRGPLGAFAERSVASISVAEVPVLLQEYKVLLKACSALLAEPHAQRKETSREH